MADITERIAEVVRKHRYVMEDRCQSCAWSGDFQDTHDAYVAEVLVAELGLTRETAVHFHDTDESPEKWLTVTHGQHGALKERIGGGWPGDPQLESRWVSAWEPAE